MTENPYQSPVAEEAIPFRRARRNGPLPWNQAILSYAIAAVAMWTAFVLVSAATDFVESENSRRSILRVAPWYVALQFVSLWGFLRIRR